MISWKLETRKISDLKPHPKNPRELSKDQARQLTKSLGKFGLIEKPIINTDNTIIGGHQRVKLLKSKGFKEVDCWVPSQALEERDLDELNIRLNRNHGEFDFDILANEWNVPDLLDWGFSVNELELNESEEVESVEKEKKKKLKTCPNCGYES